MFKFEIIRVVVNSKCNLQCLYCHKEGANIKSEYKLPNIMRGLKFLQQFGLKSVGLTGGEIFLDKNIKQLISSLATEFEIFISTNGTTLREKDILFLKSVGVMRINLSLDSVNPEKYSYLTGAKSYVQKVLSVANFAKNNGLFVNLNLVVVPNMNDTTEDILEYCETVKYVCDRVSVIRAYSSPDNKFSGNFINFNFQNFINVLVKLSTQCEILSYENRSRSIKLLINGCYVYIKDYLPNLLHEPCLNCIYKSQCMEWIISPRLLSDTGEIRMCLYRDDITVNLFDISNDPTSENIFELTSFIEKLGESPVYPEFNFDVFGGGKSNV